MKNCIYDENRLHIQLNDVTWDCAENTIVTLYSILGYGNYDDHTINMGFSGSYSIKRINEFCTKFMIKKNTNSRWTFWYFPFQVNEFHRRIWRLSFEFKSVEDLALVKLLS